jgi:hypothetical protein
VELLDGDVTLATLAAAQGLAMSDLEALIRGAHLGDALDHAPPVPEEQLSLLPTGDETSETN